MVDSFSYSSSSPVISRALEQATQAAWCHVPKEPSPDERLALLDRARSLLKTTKAVMVSHYYVHPDLQDLAEETGGFVGDSLEMARFGKRHPAQTLIVSGVRFMGETAKILSPEKRILVTNQEATCSLDVGCPTQAFQEFCQAHPDHMVVVYANTSAAVKALSDWVVTSSCALSIVQALKEEGKKILFAPDKHLGHYIATQTGATMVLWDGACIVHEEFKARELLVLKGQYPDARVLVHPESPREVVALADVVGSTSVLLQAAKTLDAPRFIVATDKGMLHQLRTQNPDKVFMEAPTAGESATCKSCAHCPWMAMNELSSLVHVLETGDNEIQLDPEIAHRALLPIERMLAFTQNRSSTPNPSIPSMPSMPSMPSAWTSGIGPA
jgi:quinolinate synthase